MILSPLYQNTWQYNPPSFNFHLEKMHIGERKPHDVRAWNRFQRDTLRPAADAMPLAVLPTADYPDRRVVPGAFGPRVG